MCGIFVLAEFMHPNYPAGQDLEDLSRIRSELRRVNACRGPDDQKSISLSWSQLPFSVDGSNNNLHMSTFMIDFYASELRLRGGGPIVQPHARGKNILCWNGEISAQENDGVKLFDILCAAQTPEEIRDIFSSIEGPYEKSDRLYFGRDPLGRRSLLVHRPTQTAPYLILSSVSAGADPAYAFSELSTEHLYSMMMGSWESFSNAEPAKVNTLIPSEDLPLIESLDDIPRHLVQTVDDFVSHLDKSVQLCVQNIPRHSSKPRIGVLFSGGIDSTILAFLAHRHIPQDEPIDLLNVAFENPRKIRIQKEGNIGGISRHRIKAGTTHENKYTIECVSYLVPDRVTGLMELEELRRLCPGRTWNFVEVNVPYEECQAARPVVESLMHPGKTVMDLVCFQSLALALYFASGGKGRIRKTPESQPEPYTSEAKVLLNGLGSDELLGGYGRHRSVYKTGGWEAVVAELQQEIDRIPTRNLGRDDRVISSHGKETRHPFLSLSLVAFLASLPINFKMDPRVEVGLGDKTLLRLAARKLRLVEASSRKKRAMQFGSHSARMDGERRGDVELE
ncbi:asparagine synthase [Gymnopilus junonius]|uniref:Asparagine synthase n=1 Tax=Gymnopilus junonius TaxID=109634 RepID=A0A9P5TV41_GYMJU|nr:asparagine synthase [Gymnopilus junonius]